MLGLVSFSGDTGVIIVQQLLHIQQVTQIPVLIECVLVYGNIKNIMNVICERSHEVHTV